tara:strand:+ start:441 stop:650 length:210 start_codon:yes stop_codon:yes gene_type:complete
VHVVLERFDPLALLLPKRVELGERLGGRAHTMKANMKMPPPEQNNVYIVSTWVDGTMSNPMPSVTHIPQ